MSIQLFFPRLFTATLVLENAVGLAGIDCLRLHNCGEIANITAGAVARLVVLLVHNHDLMALILIANTVLLHALLIEISVTSSNFLCVGWVVLLEPLVDVCRIVFSYDFLRVFTL